MSNISGILSSNGSIFADAAYTHRNTILQNPTQQENKLFFQANNNKKPFDTINISDDAREASSQNDIEIINGKAIANKIIAEQNNADQIKTIVGGGKLDSGATVSVYTLDYVDGEEKPYIDSPDKKIMAEITKKDGSIQTITITENTLISEDAEGNLLIREGKAIQSLDSLKSRDIDDIAQLQIDYINGDNLYSPIRMSDIKNKGTDGNDVYIDLGIGSQSKSIGFGDGGNDTIIMMGESNPSRIALGSGNYKVIMAGDANNITILSEKGANTDILVNGNANNMYVAQEDGENNITINGNANNLRAYTGTDGDNNITIGGNANNLSAGIGNGENNITVGGNVNGALITSSEFLNGNNNMTVEGNTRDLKVKSGNGDNNFYFKGDISNSTFVLGNGTNNITVDGDSTSLKYQAGGLYDKNGNWHDDPHGDSSKNIITIKGDASNSNIRTSAGEDNISILGDVSGLNINLGDGLNSFLLKGDADFLNYQSGDGSDKVKIGGFINNSSVDTGDGNDKFTISGSISNSKINTSAKNDNFSSKGLVINSSINGNFYQSFESRWIPQIV